MASYAGQRQYGDIYTIGTSAIDNIANRIYREQQQRELEKRQADKALDDEFGRNVAGIKSADVPEVTQAYQDFKQASINLQKKGAKATPQDQMDVLIKKQNYFTKTGASKEEKERVKNSVVELRVDKKGKFIPTAHEVLTKRLNTPTSQIKEGDFDINNHYSFPEMAEFTKKILGTPKVKKINLTTPSKKGELYDDKEVFQEYNNPNKMYEDAYIQGSSMGNKDGFINTMLDSLDDKEKEDLKERYFAKVSSPEFKKIYGEVKPFPESAGRTDLGEATALMVMSMVDKLPTTPQETISELNAERMTDKKRKEGMEDWLKKNKITQQQHLERIKLNNEGRIYEIDNVPLKLKQQAITLPSFFGNTNEQGVDVTNWSDAELDDVLGKEKNKYGIRDNKPYEIEGKKYLKITPNGFQFQDKLGNPITVDDKEIIVNTDKRTRGLEKPVGTGKAVVRDATPKVKTTTKSGLPVFH